MELIVMGLLIGIFFCLMRIKKYLRVLAVHYMGNDAITQANSYKGVNYHERKSTKKKKRVVVVEDDDDEDDED